MKIVLIGLFTLLGSCRIVFALAKLWTFDLLNLTTTSTHPEILDIHLDIIRLGRGRIGFNGFMDFKENLYDDVIIIGSVQRSLRKDDGYSRLPFGIYNETLSSAMNKFYKTLLMPTIKKCCINAPIFKRYFVAPLTKRRVEFNSCVLSNDDMPKIMLEGFYWVTITLKRNNDFEVNVYIQSYVENIF